MPDETPALPTLQQAFAEAKAEHSAPAEQATPEPESTAPEAPDPAQHTTAPDAPAAGAESLISDSDFEAIQAKFPNDPAKQRAELNRTWTQKTQALAATRKALEPWSDLIERIESGDKAAVRELATQAGLSIADPVQTESSQTDYAGILKNSLGPELDFLGEKLAPALKQIAEGIAGKIVDERIGPIAASQKQLSNRAADEQTRTIMATFEAKHPDWKAHEPAMMAIGEKLQPNGMGELEYLDLLYFVATKDVQQGEALKKTVQRMVKGASEAEASTRTLPEKQVTRDPNRKLTFREAYEEAKRELTTR